MIGKVDITTGDVTLVGSAGVILTDIAIDPSGGLWGITGTSLFRIDKTTGAASAVGAFGRFGVLNSLVFGTDGVLYAASNQLFTIDTNTGRASPVGPIGYSSAGDLAFLDGTLYLAATGGQLATVNKSTGTGTFVGAMGINQVFGLAAANDGALLAGAGDGIYRVDPATGASTMLFSLAGQGLGAVYGAAFFDDPNELPGRPTEVPEPASQLLTGLLVVGAGGVRRWLSSAGT